MKKQKHPGQLRTLRKILLLLLTLSLLITMLPLGATLASSEGESGTATEGTGTEGTGSAPPSEGPSGSGGAQAENPGAAAPDAGLDAGDKNAGEAPVNNESPSLSQAPEASGGMLTSFDLGPLSAPPITIDVSLLASGSSGIGWTYTPAVSPTPAKLTFNSAATDNEYIIIKTNANLQFAMDVEIAATVDNMTLRYDGSNIKMYVNTGITNPTSGKITVKGGANNTIIYDKTTTMSNSDLVIDSGATGTTVLYDGVSHLTTYNTSPYLSAFSLTNNGANTTINVNGGYFRTFNIINGGPGTVLTNDGVKIDTGKINQNSTGPGGKMTLTFRGVNTFASIHQSSFPITLADNTNLDLFLSGSTTIGTDTASDYNSAKNGNGYIQVPSTASLTIDSADNPGSDQGSIAISRYNNNSAVIGGVATFSGSNNANGTINIKGGTVKAVMSGLGAIPVTAGGAAIGSGQGMIGAGAIVIDKGPRVIAKAVDGAAIGGGANSKGYVTIKEGAVVDARNTRTDNSSNSGGGAAIGGGVSANGYVTIEKGTIVTAKSSNGAAIGGGANNTVGEVTINGGKIDAESVHSGTGAAIGGGGTTGSSSIMGIPHVTINGGELNLRSYYGANIGRGGTTAGASSTALPDVGYINIYKARITGDYTYGTAIGYGQNSMFWPAVYISTDVDLIAFGREWINMPGIDIGDKSAPHTGTTYVNASFGTKKGAADGLMVVYDVNDPDIPVRVEKIPFPCNKFTFTTGATAVKHYNIFTGTFSGGLDQVIRLFPGPAGSLPIEDIYSVNDNHTYRINGHNGVNRTRCIEVQYGNGDTFKPRYIAVNEEYVDIYGNPIPGKSFTATMVPNDGVSQYQLTTEPQLNGYIYRGFKWDAPPDSSGTDFYSGLPTPRKPTLNPPNYDTVYFVFTECPTHVDVTVSKTVTGNYGDKTRPFDFAVTFKTIVNGNEVFYDPGETVGIVGGVISGSGASAPQGSELTVGADGKVTFSLKHGQTITFTGVPVDDLIQIEETSYTSIGYSTTFKDSANSGDTPGSVFALDTVGFYDRTFDFKNAFMTIAPMGIGGMGLLIVLPLLAVGVLMASQWGGSFMWRRLNIMLGLRFD